MKFSAIFTTGFFLGFLVGGLVLVNYSGSGYTKVLPGQVGERLEEIARSPGDQVSLSKATLLRQLFDISFELDNPTITDIKELTSRVIFTSFGTEPTFVGLTFTIINEAGEEIYSENDYILVKTEEVLTKKFEVHTRRVESGKYTLVLKTLYNVDVEDEFSQNFTIEKPLSWLTSIWFWIPVFIVSVLILNYLYYETI